MRRFKAKDNVFHSGHGAGTIKDVQKIEVAGALNEYYVVELVAGSILMVPAQEADDSILEPLISISLLKEVLAAIPEELSADFRNRQRAIENKYSTGDQEQAVEILRDLVWREHTSELSGGDRNLLNQAKKRIARILAAQSNIPIQEAFHQLDTLLDQIAKKE